jgi:hypothetical protein
VNTDDCKKMIRECQNDESDTLSEWEMDFLSSVENQTNHGGELTGKQMHILERIWDKLFS